MGEKSGCTHRIVGRRDMLRIRPSDFIFSPYFAGLVIVTNPGSACLDVQTRLRYV